VRGRANGQPYGTIVVIGGGCYGGYYVRQLRKARDARALSWDRLVVVDRDANCAVAAEAAADVTMVTAEWADFLGRFLGSDARPADAIVPSPLMPHLLFDWLLRSAAGAGRPVRAVAPPAIDGIPWQRAGSDRTRYVSFAEWTCPVNCIEPARCPHTRGERTWSLPVAMRAHAAGERGREAPLGATLSFHCTHRAFGVGMIDVRDVLSAEATLRLLAARGPLRALVGTVSHCHGALGVIEVG
jgi:hypothetical protein